MNEKILNNIWSHLTEKGLTKSDFDTWKQNVSGSSDVQANIHGYLVDSKLTSSDFDTWTTNTGLKKKEETEETELVSGSQEEVTESTTEVQDGGSSQASVLEEETKYKTPLTREEKIALQGNKFAKQMGREDNFTQERLLELQGGEQPSAEAPAPIPGVEQEVFTESISKINKDSDLKNIQETTMRKVVGTDPQGEVMSVNRPGISNTEARTIQENKVTDFANLYISDPSDVAKSDLYKNKRKIQNQIKSVDLEMRSLLQFRVGDKIIPVKVEELRGEDKKSYEKLQSKKEELNEELNKATAEWSMTSNPYLDEKQIYDPFTGKYIDKINAPGSVVEYGENVDAQAKKMSETTAEEDLLSLRSDLYYDILNLSKQVKRNVKDVAEERTLLGKAAQSAQSAVEVAFASKGFNYQDPVYQSVFNQVQNFPDEKDNTFKGRIPFVMSEHPFAKQLNEKLRQFDAVNRAVELNRFTPEAKDKPLIDISAMEKGFIGTILGDEYSKNPDIAFDPISEGKENYRVKITQAKPLVTALKEGGFTGDQIDKLEKASELTFGEEAKELSGNILGMASELQTGGAFVNVAKLPRVLDFARILTTQKYGKLAGGAVNLLGSGSLEATKFALTGAILDKQEEYDPSLGFAFGTLNPLSTVGGNLISKLPGAKVVDDVLKKSIPGYNTAKFTAGKAGQAASATGIVYAAEMFDKVLLKGEDAGIAYDEVVYGKTPQDPEGEDPLRKAAKLWSVMFAGGLAGGGNKTFFDALGEDILKSKPRTTDLAWVKSQAPKPPEGEAYTEMMLIDNGIKAVAEKGTPAQKTKLTKIMQDVEYNKEIEGVKNQIEDYKAEAKRAEGINGVIKKSTIDAKTKTGVTPEDIAVTPEEIKAVGEAPQSQLKQVSKVIDNQVKSGNQSPEQGTQVTNKITEIKNSFDKVGVENNTTKSEIVAKQNELEKLNKEAEGIEKLSPRSPAVQKRLDDKKSEAVKVEKQINDLASQPESNADFFNDLATNPKRRVETIYNDQWRKENPKLSEEFINKLGEVGNSNQALRELSKEYESKPTEEVSLEEAAKPVEVTTTKIDEGLKVLEGQTELTPELTEKVFEAVGEENSQPLSESLSKIKTVEDVKEVLIKQKQDAVQKPSTKEVDVRQQAEDGGAVAKGDKVKITTKEVEKEKVEVKPEAKEEVIREPRRPAKPRKPSERKVEASEYYNELSKKGVKPKQVIAEMYKKYPPSVVKDVLNKADIVSVSTIKNQSELRQVAKDLLDNARVAKGVLKLNKETVNKIADKINEIQKEVKKYLPSFQIKSSTVKQILKKPATLDLTIDKAEELVAEVSDIIERVGKEPIIKYINKTIKSVTKPSKKKPSMSPEAQVALFEVAEMLDGLNLKDMSFDQLKNISENISNIESKGKADKTLYDKTKRIAKTKRQGTIATGLYKDSKSKELNTLKEIEDYLSTGERLVVLDNNLITSSTLNQFISDNPSIPMTGAKGYETMTMQRAKRSNPPTVVKKAVSWFDPTKSNANIVTQLKRIAKGSPEIKETTDALINEITENIPLRMEEGRKELKKLSDKVLTDSFGSLKKAKKVLNKTAEGMFLVADAPMTNGVVADLAAVQKVYKEDAIALRERASKQTNEKTKKDLLKRADEFDKILEKSDINAKALDEHVKNTPGLQKFVDNSLKFYEEMSKRFEPLAIEVTGKPFNRSNYYPMFRSDKATDKKYEQSSIEELENPQTPFYNRSAMTDRLKVRTDNVSAVKTDVDARMKMLDYIENMLHAENFIPVSKTTNELFGPNLRGKIYDKIGPANFKFTQQNLDAIIDPRNSNPADIALDAINKFNRLGIAIRLGGSVKNVVKQITSFAHYGYAGLKDNLTVAEIWEAGLEIPFNSEYRKVAMDILTSDFVKNRIKKSDIDPELKTKAISALSGTGEKAWKWYQNVALSPIIAGDIAGVITGGIPFAVAKYRKVKTTPKGQFDKKAAREAYKRFSAESTLSQQSGAQFTLTPLQRTKMGRIFNTYRTAQTQAFNKSMQGWIDMTDKSNDFNQKRKGFFQWQYFSRAAAGFSAISSGLFASYVLLKLDNNYEKEEEIPQDVYETIVGTAEGYIQGFGLQSYLPLMMTNYAMGRPVADWTLPPAVKESTRFIDAAVTLGDLGFSDKTYDELSDSEKKKLTFVLNNYKKIVERFNEEGGEGILKELMSESENYSNPSFESIVNGQPFKRNKGKKVKDDKKEKKTSKSMKMGFSGRGFK